MCEWVDVLKASLTPLIAAIAAYIAYQQWVTNRNKLRHELFNLRFELYAKTYNVLIFVSTGGSVPQEQLMGFRQILHKSDFLLDKSLSTLLSEIDDKYDELQTLSKELSALNIKSERKQNIEKQRQIKNWMEAQKKNIKSKFSKYLKVDA